MLTHTSLLTALAALASPSVANGVPSGPVADAAALIERAGCQECHNPDGVASDTRLVFPGPGAPARVVQDFGENLLDLVNVDDLERSRLLRKPTKRVDHAGGQKVVPGSVDEKVLRAWIQHLARTPRVPTAIAVLPFLERPSPPAGETSVLRRLTSSQYDNTVRDLLGDITGPARQFPPEDFVDGYKNQYLAQATSPLLAEAYNGAAQQLAENAVRSIRTGDPHHLLPCKPASKNAARTGVCRDTFVREFGRRAFRRPLSDEELAHYTMLFSRQGDLLAGVRIVVETMLQSPKFVYVHETTDETSRRFGRASRLAYFLWNTMPDDVLMERAARGELDTQQGAERAAREMLAHPKAHQAVDEFVSQWLRFDRLFSSFKDRKAYPQFTQDVQVAMREETRRFVDDLIWNDRDFTTAFSADHTFVNAELAAFYDLPAPMEDFARVTYPKASERTGLLGQGLFLASTGKPSDTSPTGRGLFVREHFLCQSVPPPPASVNMDLPTQGPSGKPLTNRERLTMHLSIESCAGCHNLIDTIGFGFEKFDTVGQRREKARGSRGKKPASVELVLDTRGAIAGIADSQFSGAGEVGGILAASPQCQQCISKQVFRYAMGRHEGPGDRLVLARVFDDFKRSGFHFKELLIAVSQWTEFPAPVASGPEAAPKAALTTKAGP